MCKHVFVLKFKCVFFLLSGFNIKFIPLCIQTTGDAAGEDGDSDSDSDDDDDDVRVTIGDIKTGAPQYTQVLFT